MKTFVDGLLGFIIAFAGSLTSAVSVPGGADNPIELSAGTWLIAFLFGITAFAKTVQSRLYEPKPPQ